MTYTNIDLSQEIDALLNQINKKTMIVIIIYKI